MHFQDPGFLWLLLFVPLVWLLPRRATDPRHAALRSAVLAFCVLALARPVVVSGGGPEHVAVVVDRSASADADQHALALERVGEILDAFDDGARATVVEIGGGGALLELDSGRLAGHVAVEAAGSPLSTALELAHHAIPRGGRGAVFVLSDGLATDRRWGPAVQAFAEREIPVHTLALLVPGDDVRPVALTPHGTARAGHETRLSLDVVGGPAVVDVVLEGPAGELARVEELSVDERATAVLAFEPEAPGFLPVTARVDVVRGRDVRPDNQSLATTLAVQDPLRVLYLGGRGADGAASLATLVGGGFDLEVRPASDAGALPLDEFELCLIDDLPASEVPAEVQRSLVEEVTRAGMGLLMSGGESSFGPGGWHDTPIADALPVGAVQKEEKRDPSTTLVVIIDTSGSMGGERVQLAKEVARLAMRRLLPHDKVGLVEFYGAKRWAAPIQPASNAIEIERALNRLDAGGGTVILPAIEEAFYGLKNVNTRYKHVLVLTDGGVETGAFEPLLRSMAEDGINVSTVLIGPDAHSEFLVNLANWGQGRFYSVPNRFNLPEILLKQPATANLPPYRPGAHPVRARGGSGWWGDSAPTEAPALAGYVETELRDGAQLLLETVEGSHPILASWQYGLGRATAFPTEPVGPGAAPWMDWDGYGEALARVLARTAAPTREPYRFELERHGDELALTAHRRVAAAPEPVAERLAWGGVEAATLTFRERAPGIYQATFAHPAGAEARVLAGTGGRSSGVRLASPAREDVAPETQVDPLLALDLARLADATGGSASLVRDALVAPRFGGAEDPPRVARWWPLCALLALLVYLAEILYRRWPERGLARVETAA